ncbi:hypothetical protein DVH24_026079 [Malus domestica]|uniref:Uncharacterized protein n=1 Tax=Malus domestica TaxID=3750 RepID=A0A498KNR3_MALDO|nr:hypothetical protein DVH24_026079 [Malus domestica]
MAAIGIRWRSVKEQRPTGLTIVLFMAFVLHIISFGRATGYAGSVFHPRNLAASDLDCRMEMMKSNCRKAAMETRQQHIQVDLCNLMAFDPHHSFPSIPFSNSGLFEIIAFEKLIENLLLEIGILFGLIPSVKCQTGACVLCNLKPENMWGTKSEWFLLLRTAATPHSGFDNQKVGEKSDCFVQARFSTLGASFSILEELLR